MRALNKSLAMIGCSCIMAVPAHAQNWTLSIKDNTASTPVNQANGVSGGTATLYGAIFNFTGTVVSDDGMGSPAPATTLDFAGFGFTRGAAQYDLGGLFTPATPGYPQVVGSNDGSTPGASGYVALGTFDLSSLTPGTYEEDFTAGAFPDDANSTVPFNDITGTLTLRVNAAPVPEFSTWQSLGALILLGGLLVIRRLHRKRG